MATSGRITGSFSGGSASARFTYICAWERQSFDRAARTSYVKFDWIVYKTNYAYRTFKNPTPWAATIDGQSQGENINFDSPASYNNQEQIFKTTYATIQHNSDGTKSFSVSSTLDLSGTSAGTGNLSDTITLDPIAVNPPVVNTLTISDIGTGYSSVGAYVAGFTKLRLTATATQGDGALATYSFYRDSTLLGTVTTSATTATLDMTTFEPAGSFVYSVTVTDAYGLSGSRALSATTIYSYSKPVITVDVYRCDSSGNEDNDGEYGYINMTWTVAAVGSNAAVIHQAVVNGNTYTTFPQIVGGLSTDLSYPVEFTVGDKIGQPSTATEPISISFINREYYPSNRGGMSIGEPSQEDKFIVNHPSIFRHDVDIQGDLNLSDFGAFITSGATQYRDQITTNHSAWGYRYGTVSGNGLLIISLSAQKTAGTAGAELVVNVCKQNGSSYDEYAIEQISTAGDTNRWTAINVVAVMKVSNGDKIRLGVYRWSALTVVADTNILALGATVTLDSNFTA